MLIALAVMIVVALVVLVLLALALEGGRPWETTLYCPLHETVVEVKGDRCFAHDDGRLIGSMWGCQRECLMQREANV